MYMQEDLSGLSGYKKWTHETGGRLISNWKNEKKLEVEVYGIRESLEGRI